MKTDLHRWCYNKCDIRLAACYRPQCSQKPKDVDYPVWVSFAQDTTYLPQEQTVTLKLCIDPALIAPVHIAKWGTILNYSYIPLNEQDAWRHQQLLESYRVSDTQAYMARFYPQIKREIIDSWDRLEFENCSS